ncbi:hypothetical protein AVEN_117846-1 [Araneus ventricosus]|uniref:Tc1-like transposase DDE domain-containing protein n=1 Tax=Araneus ventricosus TaxID=182803 RepID=A0A4Y2UUN0_ARAVE|nr:hypothetical protein AVEN_117846-1 [Araneus ventricosus]
MVPTFPTGNKKHESGMEASVVTDAKEGPVICHGWKGPVDIQGPLILEWMFLGSTINAQQYNHTLQNYQSDIKSKWPGKLPPGVILLHDNARLHTAKTTKDALSTFR